MSIANPQAPQPASDRLSGQVLPALKARLDARCVLEGAAAQARPATDWSGAPSTPPRVVVLARTPQDVAAVLEICQIFDQPVCIQGGLTGLAGGANPQAGELVLSLAGLDRIEDFDAVGGTAVVQAGVTLERFQGHAAGQGWLFPLDLGARGSCTLGGNAATNAGGNRVLRFGMMRESVLGLEVALPDGTLMTMLDRVIKNNAGFDLKHLFIGSEGALGIITRLSLKLVPLPTATRTALCAAPSFPAATALLREARRRLPGLAAFELMWADYFDAAARTLGRPSPLSAPAPLYVLLETLDSEEAAADLALGSFLEASLAEGTIVDAAIAQSLDQAKGLWAFREAIAELLGLIKPNITFDVSVALPRMDGFVREARAALEQRFADRHHLFFGHLGDGNLHLLTGPYPDPADLLRAEALVYEAVEAVQGSVSAEHGIGVVKKDFLHHSRSAAEIELMRALKRTTDPKGILGRGRIFDP